MLNLTVFSYSTELDTTTPWVRDRWQYASDGAIIVRRPTDSPDNVRQRKVPRTEKYFSGTAICDLDWPRPDLADCQIGDDRSVTMRVPKTRVGNRTLAGHYALLIYLLGGVKYDPAGGAEDAIHFRAADGTEGVVMPFSVSVHDKDPH